MIYTQNKLARWKLFEHYATRVIMNSDGTRLSPREYADFLYLKLYFAEDFIQGKLKPWLPNFLTEMTK